MQRLCNVHATTKEHSMHGPCTMNTLCTLPVRSVYATSMQRLCNVYATSLHRPCTVLVAWTLHRRCLDCPELNDQLAESAFFTWMVHICTVLNFFCFVNTIICEFLTVHNMYDVCLC